MIIAVDFDGTLAVTEYPEIIEPILEVFQYCKEIRSRGDTLILNTCRHGKELLDAIYFCNLYGLQFDYVNENTPEKIAKFGDSRKIYADLYIDDHNMSLLDVKARFIEETESQNATSN